MPNRPLIGAALLTAAFCYVRPASAADDAARSAHAKCEDAFDSAQRLTQLGKLQDALEQLIVCAQPSCPSFLSRECTDDYERIKLSMPTVTLVATDAQGSPLTEVAVTMDGKRVADRIAGLATPVDPGLHQFVFEHVGDPPVTVNVLIAEGEKNTRVVAQLGATQPSSSQPVAAAPAPAPAPSQSEAPASTASAGVPLGTYIFGGLGVAALGTGVVFRLIGAADYNSLAEDCRTSCTSEQVDPVKTKYTVSNISLGVGAAALVAGGVFYFIDRGGASKQASAQRVQARPVYLVGGGAAGVIEGKF